MSINYSFLEKINKDVQFYKNVIGNANLKCRIEDFDAAINMFDIALKILEYDSKKEKKKYPDSEYSAIMVDKAKAMLMKSRFCKTEEKTISLRLKAKKLFENAYNNLIKTNDFLRIVLAGAVWAEIQFEEDGDVVAAFNSFKEVVKNLFFIMDKISQEQQDFFSKQFANILAQCGVLYIEAMDQSQKNCEIKKDKDEILLYLKIALEIFLSMNPNDKLVILDIKKTEIGVRFAYMKNSEYLEYSDYWALIKDYDRLLSLYKKFYKNLGLDEKNRNLIDVYINYGALWFEIARWWFDEENYDKTKEYLEKCLSKSYIALEIIGRKIDPALGTVLYNLFQAKFLLYRCTSEEKYLQTSVEELSEYIQVFEKKDNASLKLGELYFLIGRALVYLRNDLKNALVYLKKARSTFIAHGYNEESKEVLCIDGLIHLVGCG